MVRLRSVERVRFFGVNLQLGTTENRVYAPVIRNRQAASQAPDFPCDKEGVLMASSKEVLNLVGEDGCIPRNLILARSQGGDR